MFLVVIRIVMATPRPHIVSSPMCIAHGILTLLVDASRVTTASVIPDSSNTSSDEGSASRERGGESSESQRSAALSTHISLFMCNRSLMLSSSSASTS